MLRFIIPATIALAVVPGIALAQSTTGTSDTGKSASAGQGAQSLPQQIQAKLRDQGFTNVEVVPGSFLVSAKDKQGDSVTMVIGPSSMTVFTMHTPDGSSTTGSGSNQKKSGSK